MYKTEDEMKNYILGVLLFLVASNVCFAQQLVLSDVIKEAREALNSQTNSSCPNESEIKPVANSTNNIEEKQNEQPQEEAIPKE